MYRHANAGQRSNNRTNRREEISKQEQLLLQRKREIEQKLKATSPSGDSNNAQSSIKPESLVITENPHVIKALFELPPVAISQPHQIEIVNVKKPKEEEEEEKEKDDVIVLDDDDNEKAPETSSSANMPNKFVNDGSFMERFRRMQEEMKKAGNGSVKVESSAASQPPPPTQVEPTRITQLTPAGVQMKLTPTP